MFHLVEREPGEEKKIDVMRGEDAATSYARRKVGRD